MHYIWSFSQLRNLQPHLNPGHWQSVPNHPHTGQGDNPVPLTYRLCNTGTEWDPEYCPGEPHMLHFEMMKLYHPPVHTACVLTGTTETNVMPPIDLKHGFSFGFASLG